MNQLIQDAAGQVARAEAALIAAKEQHDAAVDRAHLIQSRIADVEGKRQTYRDALAAGELTAKEAGALIALADDDAADLRKLLADAQANAASLRPTRETEALEHAKAQLAKAQAQAEFSALHAHVRQLESAFIGALAELAQLGVKLGSPASMGSVYQFDNSLRSAVSFGSIPGGPR